MTRGWARTSSSSSSAAKNVPIVSGIGTGAGGGNRARDGIPIVRTGTPLVRGHDREVGAVTWTYDGKLVTVGDDFSIRCWSEDRAKAADLRTGGETEGRRWGCGWADVGDDWDLPDDDGSDDDE